MFFGGKCFKLDLFWKILFFKLPFKSVFNFSESCFLKYIVLRSILKLFFIVVVGLVIRPLHWGAPRCSIIKSTIKNIKIISKNFFTVVFGLVIRPLHWGAPRCSIIKSTIKNIKIISKKFFTVVVGLGIWTLHWDAARCSIIKSTIKNVKINSEALFSFYEYSHLLCQ